MWIFLININFSFCCVYDYTHLIFILLSFIINIYDGYN
jgi:hypothetical protein